VLRRLLVLLLVVLAAACASGAETPGARLVDPYSARAPSTTSAKVPATTRTAEAAEPEDLEGRVQREEAIEFTTGLMLDIHAPRTGKHHPVAVLVHGGGWVTGHRYTMSRLADALAARGVVTYNVDYRLVGQGGGYPATFEDLACAVRFARADSVRFGGEGGRIAVVGHSAGGHLAAVIALAGDGYHGDCMVDDGSALPDAMVGLSGPYDPRRFRVPLSSFFGGPPESAADAWSAGNPFQLLGANPSLVVRLAWGEEDAVVPEFYGTSFQEALAAAGYDATFTVVPGADHGGIRNPRSEGAPVVDLVIEALTTTSHTSPPTTTTTD
jgi:acetyl esterase/lipase